MNKRRRRLDQPFNVSVQCRVWSYQFFDDPGWCSGRVWARTSCSADRCSSDMGILISKNLVIWASPFSYYLSGLGLRYGYRGCPYYESFGNGDAHITLTAQETTRGWGESRKWSLEPVSIVLNTSVTIFTVTNAPCLPPKFFITIVSSFPWVLQSSQGKLKTMIMQNFGE